jgi:hypothetical protein
MKKMRSGILRFFSKLTYSFFKTFPEFLGIIARAQTLLATERSLSTIEASSARAFCHTKHCFSSSQEFCTDIRKRKQMAKLQRFTELSLSGKPVHPT